MSADASAPAREEPNVETTDYQGMLDTLDIAIEEAARKVESGRVYDESKEKTRQGWVRALAYAVNVRRQVAENRDLEELAEQIEELKNES